MAYRWPGYYERQYPGRTYALDIDGEIVTEYGERLSYENWLELRTIMFESNFTLLTNDLYRYLDMGAVKDERALVAASDSGGLRAISLAGDKGSRYARRRRTIVPAIAWGECGYGMLKRIRACMDHCGVGDRNTPSALGIAIMRTVWQEKHLPWHRAAPAIVQRALAKESPSPRTETPALGWEGDEAWEYDLRSAFAHHFNIHPTGRVISIPPDDMDPDHIYDDMPTWFRKCWVMHPPEMDFTNLPRRVEGQWVYRTRYLRGRNMEELQAARFYDATSGGFGLDPFRAIDHSYEFQTWLWKEQAETAAELGVLVLPLGGWGWLTMTEDNAHCVDRLLELKATADDSVIPYIKLAIVCGIGRHAMRSDDWQVVDHFTEDGDCKPLVRFQRSRDQTPWTEYYLRLRNKNQGGMIHWQRYTVMLTNETLFALASKYQKDLLMTNFDSVTLRRKIRAPEGWKELPLTGVQIPYTRAIISNEKRRTPGRVVAMRLG